MSTPRKIDTGHDITTAASDTARQASVFSLGGILTVLVSALALIISGVSLYQSVIKQAQLHLFVADTVSYTRDPDGSYEVFVVPVTVANSGARDGIVSALSLTVRNKQTGRSRKLRASYFAGAGFFSTKADLAKQIRRPKSPFAPLAVSGRGGYTGTILFYPRDYQKEKIVTGKGSFELTLEARAEATEHFGLLDRFWGVGIAPVKHDFDLPGVSRYFQGRMLSGHTIRLFKEE